MEDTEAIMATPDLMDIMVTMERGLLRLSLLLRPLLPPRLRLIPGMDTMDTGHMAMDTTDTGLMAMDTTMARGPQMLSLLLRPMPLLGPMLIRGMDTTDTMDTGLMVMDTGERSKKPEYCQLILNIVLFLPTLKHLNTSVYKTFSFENFKNILFC